MGYCRKHDKSRPTLPALVASNPNPFVRQKTSEAFGLPPPSRENTEALSECIKLLTKDLRGIGPATATAILAAGYPSIVPFFSDEAFRWIMWDEPSKGPGSWKRKIDYNLKEYLTYYMNVQKMIWRLQKE